MHYVRGASRALALAAVLAISAFVGTARAGDESENGTSNGPSVTTNATLTSDYRFRGFTQTQERPALQGGFEVIWPNFYVGLWASSVDFGDVLDAGGFHNVASHRGRRLRRLQATSSGAPESTCVPSTIPIRARTATSPTKTSTIFEGNARLQPRDPSRADADLQIYYSPDYQGRRGQNWVFETGIARKFGPLRPITPTFSAMIGCQRGRREEGRHRLRLLERRRLVPVRRLLRVRHPLL